MDFLTDFVPQFGVGFTAALVLIVVVLAALKKFIPDVQIFAKKPVVTEDPKIQEILIRLEDICDKTDEMYEWHNISDPDGVKIWYVRRSLDAAVVRLSEVMVDVAQSLREVTVLQTAMKEDLRIVTQDVHQLKAELRALKRHD